MVKRRLREAGRGFGIGSAFTLGVYVVQQLDLAPFELFSWGVPIFTGAAIALAYAAGPWDLWVGAAAGGVATSLALMVVAMSLFENQAQVNSLPTVGN